MDKEDFIKIGEINTILNNIKVCGKQDCTNILAGIERTEALLKKYAHVME